MFRKPSTAIIRNHHHKIMNITHFTFPSAFLICLCSASLSSAAPRNFEDKFGRIINAELVSHAGASLDTVTINKGGKEMVVKVDIFSAKDQEFIRTWMKNEPATVDYRFRITAERKTTKPAAKADGSDPFIGKPANSETFNIKVTNLTRQPVSGMALEYRVYTSSYPTTMADLRDRLGAGKGFGGLGRKGRAEKIEPVTKFSEHSQPIEGEIKYNHSTTIETKPVSKFSAENPFTNDRYEDEVLGIIVRIYDAGGKMVHEHRDSKVKEMKWATKAERKEEFGIVID